MNSRLYWGGGLSLACVVACFEAQRQKGIACLSSKTYPPWHLTVAWFHHSCLNVRHCFVQQMRAGRHSAPQQLCWLTSAVINGGYKVNGNDILHHNKLLRSLCSDPRVIWKCLFPSLIPVRTRVSLPVCSLWLRHGSERLLSEERGLSVPPGLPEATWHALQ